MYLICTARHRTALYFTARHALFNFEENSGGHRTLCCCLLAEDPEGPLRLTKSCWKKVSENGAGHRILCCCLLAWRSRDSVEIVDR